MGYGQAGCKLTLLVFYPRKFCEAVTIRFALSWIAAWEPIATVVAIPPETPLPTSSWVAFGFAVILAAVALRGFVRLRATTLSAPCLWAAVSAICLAALTYAEANFDGIRLSVFRFAMAVTTLCPLMAVLGAKRPQDRGWQWVVFSLWVVLVLPAGQALLLPSGSRLELFAAWQIFLWALIGIGMLNYLPTRHWLATLFVATGQVLLLREQLGFENLLAENFPQTIGVGCLLLAGLSINGSSRRKKSLLEPIATSLAPQEIAWLNFRDSFGALWALRVLGRINHAAELREWPLQLHWSGFAMQANQEPTEKHLAELSQTMSGLLRRFAASNSE